MRLATAAPLSLGVRAIEGLGESKSILRTASRFVYKVVYIAAISAKKERTHDAVSPCLLSSSGGRLRYLSHCSGGRGSEAQFKERKPRNLKNGSPIGATIYSLQPPPRGHV